MLRRDDWWRKFCLLIAMVLFGIWHNATTLFALFGVYHGALLILHRQAQQVERNFDWQPSSNVWSVFSWMLTMALVNLGWIFFRAGSLVQAGQMLSALFSPAGYEHPLLPRSLYFLIAVVGLGYAATLIALDALDTYAERLQTSANAGPSVAAIALRDRWAWLAPIWACACVLVLTLVPHQSRAANVFMYRFF
jgi:hypothetical protein